MSNLPPPPGVRKVPKSNRRVLLIGGVAAAGVVYWAYKKNAASSATTGTTDPSIDPTTGLPYATGQYDYSGGGASGVTPSLYGYTDPYGNTIIPGSGQAVVTAPSTNAGWAQQAASLLVNAGQYDSTLAYGTLGMYVGSGGKVGLSDTQMALVQAAYGLAGPPPQPIDPPHVAAPAGQTTSVPNGFYANLATGEKLQVQGGTLFHISGPTWKRLAASKPKVTNILPNWAGYKLPRGGSI